ncbi:TRADD-N-associated membrane domain-containing protein [Nostoc sp.]
MHDPLNNDNIPDQNADLTEISPKTEHIDYVFKRRQSQQHQKTADFQEPEEFSKQWFKERSRQAKLSFNVAVGLAGTTAALSIALALSVAVGKVSVAAIAGLSTSGAVSAYCFKLSQNANKQLDETVKKLLDNTASSRH